ncbi:MAG: hypothetical protein ACE5JQ_00735 [Candidatus Methylomirabilales bacterium]
MSIVKIVIGFLLALLLLHGFRTEDSALRQCGRAIVHDLAGGLPYNERREDP